MAKETKIFCDRCKKEISNKTWRYILRLPRKITIEMLHEGKPCHDFKFYLCEDCTKEVYRILEGREDGK